MNQKRPRTAERTPNATRDMERSIWLIWYRPPDAWRPFRAYWGLPQRRPVWTVGYGGKSCPLNDSKGLGYLAHLLRHPAAEFHVLDLAGVIEAKAMVKKPVNLHTVPRGVEDLEKAGSTSAVSATRARCSTIKPRLLIDAGSPSCGKNWKGWEALRSLGFDEMACLEVGI